MTLPSKEQQAYIVEMYFITNIIKQVKAGFADWLPERELPSTSTIQRNVEKYRKYATILNTYRDKCDRKRTVRSDESIKTVRHLLENNPQLPARRNYVYFVFNY